MLLMGIGFLAESRCAR